MEYFSAARTLAALWIAYRRASLPRRVSGRALLRNLWRHRRDDGPDAGRRRRPVLRSLRRTLRRRRRPVRHFEIISLKRIRSLFGPRWRRTRSSIYQLSEIFLRRELGPDVLLKRRGNQIFVHQPSVRRRQARRRVLIAQRKLQLLILKRVMQPQPDDEEPADAAPAEAPVPHEPVPTAPQVGEAISRLLADYHEVSANRLVDGREADAATAAVRRQLAAAPRRAAAASRGRKAGPVARPPAAPRGHDLAGLSPEEQQRRLRKLLEERRELDGALLNATDKIREQAAELEHSSTIFPPLRTRIVCHPMWMTDKHALLSLRCEAVVTTDAGDVVVTAADGRPGHMDSDTAQLDKFILQAVAGAWKSILAHSSSPTITVPVHATTLDRRPLWEPLADIIDGPPEAFRKSLMVEIIGVDTLAPGDLLEHAIAVLRPRTRAVIGRVPAGWQKFDSLRNRRLLAVGADFRVRGPDIDLATEAEIFATLVRRAGMIPYTAGTCFDPESADLLHAGAQIIEGARIEFADLVAGPATLPKPACLAMKEAS